LVTEEKSTLEGEDFYTRTRKLPLKRDGRVVSFNKRKIGDAIFKAAQSVGGRNRKISQLLADEVIEYMETKYVPHSIPSVEDIHDSVEKVLIEEGHALTAKAYILYRDHPGKSRARQAPKPAHLAFHS